MPLFANGLRHTAACRRLQTAAISLPRYAGLDGRATYNNVLSDGVPVLRRDVPYCAMEES